MQSTRRELLRSAALLGGAAIFSRGLVACALDGRRADGETGSDSLVACEPPVISNNHGHALVVAAEDVAVGTEKTYSIQGTSGHDHVVTLTANDFAELAAGRAVTATSSSAFGHAHEVTVVCAGRTPDAGRDADPGTGRADAAPTSCEDGATATSITSNHGHALVVPKADVEAGAPATYSIRGTSAHPHTVTLCGADFVALRAGKTVSVVSSTDNGHAHAVAVLCG